MCFLRVPFKTERGRGRGGGGGHLRPLCASMIVHIGRRRYACAARQAQRQQVRSSAICERAHNLAQHRSRQIEQTHIGNPGKIHQKRRAFQWHPAARAARPAPPGRSLLASRCLSALAEREREQRRIIARKRPTAAPRRRWLHGLSAHPRSRVHDHHEQSERARAGASSSSNSTKYWENVVLLIKCS